MAIDKHLQARFWRTPATWIIVAASALVWIATLLTHGIFGSHFAYIGGFQDQPWGILTFPIASYGITTNFILIPILFYLFWWLGESTEVRLGTVKFLIYFFAASIVGALCLTVGGSLTHQLVVAEPAPNCSGLQIVTGCIAVDWSMRNRDAQVRLFGVLPIPSFVLAILSAVFVFLGYSAIYNSGLMGLAACVPLLLSLLIALGYLPGFAPANRSVTSRVLKAAERRDENYYDDVRRREQERAERERLRKLFEGSLDDESKRDD